MSDGAGADGGIRNQLPDDTLLVFLSDTHIGGAAGSDIFESAAEFTRLLEDLNRHNGPVELVLAGDFLDVLRMEGAASGDPVAATLTRPEYQGLLRALQAFAGAPGHRVVYLVGNHDAEVWWNPQIRRSLTEAGLVDGFGLSYMASFASLPDQLLYCEHGNQFDPANTIVDYANPLDTPVGAHVLTEMIRPIGSGAENTRGLNLRDVRYAFPVAAHPGPAEWIAGRIFYQFLGQLLRWLLVLLAFLVIAYAAYAGLTVVVGRSSRGSRVLRSFVLETTYGVAVLVFALAVVFLISRRTTADVVTTLAARFPWLAPESERSREEAAIRRLLEDGRPPPMAGAMSGRAPAVFVFRSHPRPRDLGADARRREQDGDRQHRLLAPPAPAGRGVAGCPARVCTRLRPHPRPGPIRPGRGDGRALEPSQASPAAPVLDRARRHRRQGTEPAPARRPATAGGPADSGPRSEQASLTCRLGRPSPHGRLRPGPISLLAGTAAMETPAGPERISRRLREQFAPAYLAISGLVQVLVLDALITKVEGGYAIRQFADEERDVPLALATRHWYRAGLAGAVAAFGLLGWLLYDALGLASAQLAVAVAVAGLVGVVVIIASSVPMWNQILRYARGEAIGAGRSGRASHIQRS